jgi:hypothetical protein
MFESPPDVSLNLGFSRQERDAGVLSELFREWTQEFRAVAHATSRARWSVVESGDGSHDPLRVRGDVHDDDVRIGEPRSAVQPCNPKWHGSFARRRVTLRVDLVHNAGDPLTAREAFVTGVG